MREAFVGFDSAWGDRVPGGIVSASFEDGGLVGCEGPHLARFGDAARMVGKLRNDHDFVLVALDQPTLVANDTGTRPVDRVAGALIGKLGGGVQPANRGKGVLGPQAPVWRFLERLGARQCPPAARNARDGLHLIEVFPALALPALEARIMRRGRRARYNPKVRTRKGRKVFSLGDWKLVATAVARHAAEMGVAPLARWAGARQAAMRPRRATRTGSTRRSV